MLSANVKIVVDRRAAALLPTALAFMQALRQRPALEPKQVNSQNPQQDKSLQNAKRREAVIEYLLRP